MTGSQYNPRRIGSATLGLAMGLCLLLAWGCGGSKNPPTTKPDKEKVSQPIFSTTQPADKPATFQSLSYIRTGGFAGGEVRILVSPDGSYVVNDTRKGQYLGHLTQDQLTGLAKTFSGWKKLDDSYLPDPKRGVADDFRYEVRYGSKKVYASDLAESLPELFKTAIAELEAAVEMGKK